MARSTEARGDPDARFGLPLMRARSALVEPALWKPALVASHARSNPAWKDTVPSRAWRYKVFVVPPGLSPDPQAEWTAQEANSFLRFEAERQNTFFRISLDLGRRLRAGELQGWGRLGSMVGPWTAIPAEAWSILQVQLEIGFGPWHRGHLAGPGMEFWSTRILDRIGLPLSAAALAYGPPDAAEVVQRAETFGIAAALAPAKPGSLDARMREEDPTLVPAPQPGSAEVADALQRVTRSLVDALRAGTLIATGQDARGAIRPVSAAEWQRGIPDFDRSTLVLNGTELQDVHVRPPDPGKAAPLSADAPAAAPPSTGPTVKRSTRSTEVERWFIARVDELQLNKRADEMAGAGPTKAGAAAAPPPEPVVVEASVTHAMAARDAPPAPPRPAPAPAPAAKEPTGPRVITLEEDPAEARRRSRLGMLAR